MRSSSWFVGSHVPCASSHGREMDNGDRHDKDGAGGDTDCEMELGVIETKMIKTELEVIQMCRVDLGMMEMT